MLPDCDTEIEDVIVAVSEAVRVVVGDTALFVRAALTENVSLSVTVSLGDGDGVGLSEKDRGAVTEPPDGERDGDKDFVGNVIDLRERVVVTTVDGVMTPLGRVMDKEIVTVTDTDAEALGDDVMESTFDVEAVRVWTCGDGLREMVGIVDSDGESVIVVVGE